MVDPRTIIVLILQIVTTYLGAVAIRRSQHKNLLFVVFVSVFVLFGTRLFSLAESVPAVVGASFYSLQAIGYLADVYRGKTDVEKNIVMYADYVGFFPTIVSGPIQRSETLLKQIQNGTDFSYDHARSGFRMMAEGYFYKMLIADRISALIAPIFDEIEIQTGSTLVFGMIMYGIELYADFVGYSLIAIGTARLFSFDLEANFRQPYLPVGIGDFWRRWHISLSTWLRDYVYIPLGGNRKGQLRKSLNVIIAFVVSGLWHGSGLRYIIWGLLHGFYSVAEQVLHLHFRGKEKAAYCLIVRSYL